MLQNAYFVAKIGDDTAENEQHFAEILPTEKECIFEKCTVHEHARLPESSLEHARLHLGSE